MPEAFGWRGSAATATKSRMSSASTALLADLGTLDTQVKNATGWIGSERDVYIESFESWRKGSGREVIKMLDL